MTRCSNLPCAHLFKIPMYSNARAPWLIGGSARPCRHLVRARAHFDQCPNMFLKILCIPARAREMPFLLVYALVYLKSYVFKFPCIKNRPVLQNATPTQSASAAVTHDSYVIDVFLFLFALLGASTRNIALHGISHTHGSPKLNFEYVWWARGSGTHNTSPQQRTGRVGQTPIHGLIVGPPGVGRS